MKLYPARLFVSAALLLTLPLGGCRRAKRIVAQAGGSVGVSDPTFTSEIQTVLGSGHVDGLHWADISDVQQADTQFYENRDYVLAWSKDGKPTKQANTLMEAFANAREEGLEPEDYDASAWQGRVANLGTDAGKVTFDTTMTVDASRYLNAIHMGRTDPQYFAFGIKSDSKQLDLATVLEQQVANSSDMGETLASFEPSSAQYKALKASLKQYLALAAQDHSQPLDDPGKNTVAVTNGYAGLQALAAKLQLVGDLQGAESTNAGAQGAPAPDVSAITDALKHFQSRHGLDETGKLSHDTVAALNVPITTRVQQMSDTLERWRWLPDEYQQPAILVNLPEFELRAFDGADESFRMRVVDGQSSEEEHHTPMIADHMKYLVFRPFWNLPVDIAKKDLVPHIEKSPGYLAEHNYETVNNKGEPEPATAEKIAHGGVLVRQKPGPKNSLGLVKFMFPNQFNVYLHDTDAHALFARTRRDYSHGCVRVQDPPKLAGWVLRNDSKWDPDSIAKEMNDETVTNKTVSLPKPIPIVLFYGTAYVDGGEVKFFQDMYGYDDELEKALKKGPPYPKKPAKVRAEAAV